MTPRSWTDLRPRVLSAVVLLAAGTGAAMAGPVVFGALVALVAGLMTWEMLRMMLGPARRRPVILGGVAGVLVGVFNLYWVPLQLPLVLGGLGILTLALLAVVQRGLWVCVLYGFCIGATGLILTDLAFDRPLLLLLLLGVVIMTDVGGYFAGRLIGGPKFWPSVSPKKTWAGVIGGWVASAGFAAVLDIWLPIQDWIIGWAVLISFASQLGDIAESALKRRAGVKDSSNLIPGHGGFLDRFDGVVGAALALAMMGVAS